MALDLFDTTYALSLWRGLPVTRFSARLCDLRDALPDFELRPFGQPPDDNPRLRAIVRMPTPDDQAERPVAAVSDQYDLLLHRVVATWLERNLAKAGLAEDAVADVTMTEFGERLRITVPLDRDTITPFGVPDADPYRPEIELTNSMDRSSAFSMRLRWRRVVCLNGMFTLQEDRLRSVHHVTWSRTDAVEAFIQARLSGRHVVFSELEAWIATPVDKAQVQAWIEGWLREKSGWTVRDCARIWAIVETGYDGDVRGPSARFGRLPLSDYRVGQHRKVPGDVFPVTTGYQVAQILTWITSNQRTVDMQIEGTEDVPRLMRALLDGQG